MTTDFQGLTDCFDMHVHFGPWRNSHIAKYQYSGPFENYCGIMKEAGMAKGMVFKTKDGDNLSVLEYVKRRRDTFYFSYWVEVDNHMALQEIETHDHEISGLKFHPTFEKMRVNDERLRPFWSWLDKTNKPLLVHCGTWLEFSSYKLPIEVARAYSFPVVLLHMGGGGDPTVQADALEYLSRIEKLPNVYLETSSCFQPWLIERAVSVLGDRNVVFGSDFPSHHPRVAIQAVLTADISEESRKLVLRGNARSLIHG